MSTMPSGEACVYSVQEREAIARDVQDLMRLFHLDVSALLEEIFERTEERNNAVCRLLENHSVSAHIINEALDELTKNLDQHYSFLAYVFGHTRNIHDLLDARQIKAGRQPDAHD